jgi:hypothetical protein
MADNNMRGTAFSVFENRDFNQSARRCQHQVTLRNCGPTRSTQERLTPPGQSSNRRCTRITVLADHDLPVGVATLRAFSALAIALADWPASSSTGRSASARAPWRRCER